VWERAADAVRVPRFTLMSVGMVAVHVPRGPWGYLQRGSKRAHSRIGSLRELPEALAGV
jgi:hypothetical protein